MDLKLNFVELILLEVALRKASFAANLPEKNLPSSFLDYASSISFFEKIFSKNLSLFDELKISSILLIKTMSTPVDKLFSIFTFNNIN